MRKIMAVAMGAAFVLALSAPAVDLSVILSLPVVAVTAAVVNAASPPACAKMSPVAVVNVLAVSAPVVTMWTPVAAATTSAANTNAKLVPHMSHVMELTGDVAEAGGKTTIAATELKMISR